MSPRSKFFLKKLWKKNRDKKLELSFVIADEMT